MTDTDTDGIDWEVLADIADVAASRMVVLLKAVENVWIPTTEYRMIRRIIRAHFGFWVDAAVKPELEEFGMLKEDEFGANHWHVLTAGERLHTVDDYRHYYYDIDLLASRILRNVFFKHEKYEVAVRTYYIAQDMNFSCDEWGMWSDDMDVVGGPTLRMAGVLA